MSLTVVMPAYKAAHQLPRSIPALLEAGFAPGEILLVDDASGDGTAEAAEAFGVEVLRLTKNSGAAGARNAGAAAAAGEILVFVDADVVVHPGTKARITEFFATRPDYDALFGTYDTAPPEGGVVSRFRNLLHRYVHVTNAGEAVTFWTGCGAVRAEAFGRAGGFDPAQRWVMIEDVVFGVALHKTGGRIWLDPELECAHLKAWTLKSMVRTDIFHRAMPWTRLLMQEKQSAFDGQLNANKTGRLSVLSVAASLLALPLMLLTPAVGLGLLALALGWLIWLNRGFLAMMRRVRGAREAAQSIPLLWIHYLSGGLGYAWVRLGLSRVA